MKEIGGILVVMKGLIKRRMDKWVVTCPPLLFQYGKYCFINGIIIYNNSCVCDTGDWSH